ncbi:DNA damage-inducible protein D [Escherichia coli]|nr:DNA damage-inducible protein D [Escherichia coli]
MEWAMNEHHQPFEEIKLINANGAEQWSARQLGKLLGYSEYRHFIPVLTRAKEACENSGHTIDDHFEEILDMVKIGSNAKRALKDIVLSRYACYLVVQNGDPAKPVIAAGQTYFAIQTRRQELADDEAFKQLREDEKRLFLRNERQGRLILLSRPDGRSLLTMKHLSNFVKTKSVCF